MDFREIITSKDNPSVKLYKKLAENKKFRRESGMFVLEGARLCFDAVKNTEIHILIATESAINKFSDEINDFRGNIIIISDEIGEKLSETRNTQGVFAVCKMKSEISVDDFICKNKKYIILNGLQDPANIGTIIRTADAVGMDGVLLCNCCDLYNPKVIRGTMGSIFRVNLIECDYLKSVEAMKNNNIETFAAVVDKNAENLIQCDFSNGAAVVIGNEGNGLSEADTMLCDRKLTIKMHGNIESLNAATAASIIAWEMLR